MSTRYELYYRTELGGVVFCGDFDDYGGAYAEKALLSIEFPENKYWVEEYVSHKED